MFEIKTNYNRTILNYEIKYVKNYRLKLTFGRVIKVMDKINYLHVLKIKLVKNYRIKSTFGRVIEVMDKITIFTC